MRAQYLYLKGRCFNVVVQYDPRALESFSKAVKLNPGLIEAWNELGESYWKNMNIKESQACLEGSLKRNILRSVEYAKEAVAMDPTDGVSWSVLGNAYLCQFFVVEQLPGALKSAMSAYKQAWSPPVTQMKRVADYLRYVDDISMDSKLFGEYAPGQLCTLNKRQVSLRRRLIRDLQEGPNEASVIMGRVVGSYHCENTVPFTFAIVDESMACVAVNVYNWADGRGAIIGDCVCIPEPTATTHTQTNKFPVCSVCRGQRVQLGGRTRRHHRRLRVHPRAHRDDTHADKQVPGVAVNVYNWADGRGAIIGDCVCIPEPTATTHTQTNKFP
ncbi:putative Tetratricopeptide repeat protein, partial [Operophtera brumata]